MRSVLYCLYVSIVLCLYLFNNIQYFLLIFIIIDVQWGAGSVTIADKTYSLARIHFMSMEPEEVDEEIEVGDDEAEADGDNEAQA